MIKRHHALIILAFLISKLYQFALLSLVPTQFDLSNTHFQSKAFPYNIIYKTVNWDNVYFNQLFQTGPRYEHEYVFSPLWWRLVASIGIKELDPYITGMVLSNFFQLLSAFVLYELTKVVFNRRDNKKALISALIFLLNPIGVFGSLPYSENFNCFLCFLAVYFREISFVNHKKSSYLISSVFTSLAIWTRSNSIVIGLLYLIDFLQFKKGVYKVAFISGFILFINLVVYNVLPYKDFCFNEETRRPWCDNTIPSLFTYAQTERWNNGFLKYWTPNNIPNFLFALPTIILLSQSSKHLINHKSLFSLSYLTILYLILIVFFSNVQIIIRISSFIPLTHWFLADRILEKKGYVWIVYFITWISVQTVLFGAFLPPA